MIGFPATILLKTLSERAFASLSAGPEQWDLIVNACADEFHCQPDDVDLVENDDGEEIIHVHGEAVGRLTHRWPS
jgi:hypothetical protein